jgi:uncharacterized protein (UPF0332 family)
MNVRDFLNVAQNLLSEPTEAAWRSAVSRAYYAAFHVARELLEALGFACPKAERAHAYLWRRLSNCGEPQVQNAGRELNDLRGDRNQADYEVHRSLPKKIAEGQVLMARRIIDLLDGATKEPARTVILDAMKIYERDILKEETWQL